MRIPGEKEFFNNDYEIYIDDKVQKQLQKWLTEESTTAEELECDIRDDTEGVANCLLGAEEFSEGQITLFFGYVPDSYHHPVEVFGSGNKRQIYGIPNFPVLKKYHDKSEAIGATSRPLVLVQENGIYVNSVTVSANGVSAEKLEVNIGLLKAKSMENWERIINPKKSVKKSKR